MSAELRGVVDVQARARAAGDMASFASYMDAQAVLQLRDGSSPPIAREKVRRYRVLDVVDLGEQGASRVEYGVQGGRYILAQQWERRGEGWTASRAAVEGVRQSWWRRIFVGWRRDATPERADLG
ncbi:MAG: hypothetical protein WEC75_04920 [Dehalococcoidia bacterium]